MISKHANEKYLCMQCFAPLCEGYDTNSRWQEADRDRRNRDRDGRHHSASSFFCIHHPHLHFNPPLVEWACVCSALCIPNPRCFSRTRLLESRLQRSLTSAHARFSCTQAALATGSGSLTASVDRSPKVANLINKAS